MNHSLCKSMSETLPIMLAVSDGDADIDGAQPEERLMFNSEFQ